MVKKVTALASMDQEVIMMIVLNVQSVKCLLANIHMMEVKHVWMYYRYVHTIKNACLHAMIQTMLTILKEIADVTISLIVDVGLKIETANVPVVFSVQRTWPG
jgi:hypothetical protein